MDKEDPAVERFRKYLRIPSVQPNIDYSECVNFLKNQCKEIGLTFDIYNIVPNKPIVFASWIGQQPELPSILLNSHMDVVPVYPEKWTHDPFSADKDENGNIYARGSQDMKCVTMQYLEAIRRFKTKGLTFKRTIHLGFMPDEEIGGEFGMKDFVLTEEFKKLNIGFALDEGMANPDEQFSLFYGERTIWHIFFHCSGTAGHGSLLLDDTAGEKIRFLIDKFMDLRAKEKERLKQNPNLTIGDVTTINLTQLMGGIQPNVVPSELTVVFDIRIAPDVDQEKFEKQINDWCKEAGSNINIEFEQRDPKTPSTKLDNSNPWWVAFKKVTDELNLKIKPQIFPGGTDCRFVRGVGIPALGFSPMNLTPILLHDNDEYLNENIFLKGIEIYENIIPAIANV